MQYLNLLVNLGFDLIGLFVLAVLLYYRRHRRSDLLLAYVSLNMGLFITMSLLGSVRLDISTGFGLFAILSIVQLRSKPVTQEEVAYYFAILVLGLVNGLRLPDWRVTILLDATLVVMMYVVDHRRMFVRSHRAEITLDVVHETADALKADLERRLRGQIMHYIVDEIDYVRETMVVDVRYQRDDRALQGARDQQERVVGALPEPRDQQERVGASPVGRGLWGAANGTELARNGEFSTPTPTMAR